MHRLALALHDQLREVGIERDERFVECVRGAFEDAAGVGAYE